MSPSESIGSVVTDNFISTTKKVMTIPDRYCIIVTCEKTAFAYQWVLDQVQCERVMSYQQVIDY